MKNMADALGETPGSRRPLIVWLATVSLLLCTMVVVGGITRLTCSGLSIVEWAPIMGTLPPLSEAAWQQAFSQYQRFPEYQQVNVGMTLAEFKSIYFWEYLHRLLGRLIGVAVFVPWVVFLLQRRLPRVLARRLPWLLVLGGAQGALGWFMVKSGLKDVPHVSPYRLATHLGMAFLLLGAVLWLLFGLIAPRQKAGRLRPATAALLGVLCLQVLYGALVAGRHAGMGFNTFPLMDGHLWPPGITALVPGWLNLLENNTTVQFIHRGLAWTLASFALGLFIASRAIAMPAELRRRYGLLLAAVALQFTLGMLTLLLKVPVVLAAAHQGGALVLFAATLWALF